MNDRKHSHYFKDISLIDILDVYRVCDLFEVNDAAIQHAVKKLLLAGDRGVKDKVKDIQEAIDSLERYLEMKRENNGYASPPMSHDPTETNTMIHFRLNSNLSPKTKR